MQTYEQYCPIARATEVLGERWTFIIVRNLFLGCETFTQIEDGAPGIPRSTLTQRLRHLERDELIEREVVGRSSRYRLTPAGRDLWQVCLALGNWGARWLDVAPEHCDPYNVLWSWSRSAKADVLPTRRVVVRFTFTGAAANRRLPMWFIADGGAVELCLKHPGFEEDLVVEADAEAFTLWHLGRVRWTDAVKDGRISVSGPRALARDLPTWNPLSRFATVEPAVRLAPAR
jgi:DNA-binding HxlR family transcriptional regulator